jgi:hypothetical protein
MKKFEHYSHAKNDLPEPRIHGRAHRLLLAALIASTFVITGQAGLTSVADAGLISIQILLELGRLAVVAFQVFAR